MGTMKYKGYSGSIKYSEEDNCFYGTVLGLRRDLIMFEGDSVVSLRKDFEESVDFYLKSCKERNKEPEMPYSGKLVLRISSTLHGEAAEKAASAGISLNEFINRAIQMAVQ